VPPTPSLGAVPPGSAAYVTERRAPELISVLGSQPAGYVGH